MSSIRFTDPDHWSAIEAHLAAARGERFAFGFTDLLSDGASEPTIEVVGIALIDDRDTEREANGWCVSDSALDRVHNQAAAAGYGLIEFHNHGLGPPGFSRTDEAALERMVPYMIEFLGRPYAAAVWAKGAVHAEWWRAGEDGNVERREFSTVLVLGDQLRVLNARAVDDGRFTRQLPLLGPSGQAAIASLRVALVGAGGTGSHAALQLAYTGFRDIVILDGDSVEETNLNRLVTASRADLGLLKNVVARRRLQSIDQKCRVETRGALTPGGFPHELLDVDLIIGCVDHDGPRQRLNEIAVATRTPYIDIATGVDASGDPLAVGGRVIFVRPGRPCLTCLNELDSAEVGRWAKPVEQQALDRLHGYGTNAANPSVVYLNGLAVSAALAELASWIAGSRRPADWLDIDLVGDPGRPGTYVGPLEVGEPVHNCIDCSRRPAPDLKLA
jgi:hypothetical protein